MLPAQHTHTNKIKPFLYVEAIQIRTYFSCYAVHNIRAKIKKRKSRRLPSTNILEVHIVFKTLYDEL